MPAGVFTRSAEWTVCRLHGGGTARVGRLHYLGHEPGGGLRDLQLNGYIESRWTATPAPAAVAFSDPNKGNAEAAQEGSCHAMSLAGLYIRPGLGTRVFAMAHDGHG